MSGVTKHRTGRTVRTGPKYGMTKYRVDRADCVDRILPARRPLNYGVDRGTMIMTC